MFLLWLGSHTEEEVSPVSASFSQNLLFSLSNIQLMKQHNFLPESLGERRFEGSY